MRLLVINPDFGMTREEMDERCRILCRAAGPDVSVDMKCLTASRVYLDSMADACLAGPEILRMAVQAEKEKYDAVVLYCFSDPAVDACREAIRIPVVGGGQAAYVYALSVARQFGVVVADGRRIPEKRLFVSGTGIAPERICGFEPVKMDGRGAREDREFTVSRLTEAGRTLIARDGAQAVVLGCLSYLGMADAVGAELEIPVIDAATAAVSWAASLVRVGLLTGKTAYPVPPAGGRTWDAGEISF